MSLDGTLGITLPAAAAPAFSAYCSSGQSISSGTFTKIQYQTKEFDTNSNYDNATNYRFTPTVAGYYQINGSFEAVNNCAAVVSIYKNGSQYKQSAYPASTYFYSATVSAIVYLNGSTDYVEMYGFSGGSSNTTQTGIYLNWFNGAMIRSA